MTQVLKCVLFVKFYVDAYVGGVEDSAPGHPHEEWGLDSSRRGIPCAVLVCVSTQGYALASVCCNCCVLFRLFIF